MNLDNFIENEEWFVMFVSNETIKFCKFLGTLSASNSTEKRLFELVIEDLCNRRLMLQEQFVCCPEPWVCLQTFEYNFKFKLSF